MNIYHKPRSVAAGGKTDAALLRAALGMFLSGRFHSAPTKQRKPTPRMVCSPPEVIAAWNAKIEQSKPQTNKRTRHQRIAACGSIRQFKKWERVMRALEGV